MKDLNLFNRNRTVDEIKQLSPLTWAYVGDAVYELYIRTYLTNTTNLKSHELHIKSIKYVKAKAQADLLQQLEEMLTDDFVKTHRACLINRKRAHGFSKSQKYVIFDNGKKSYLVSSRFDRGEL